MKSIDQQLRQLEKELLGIETKLARQATASALNLTARKVVTDTVRETAQDLAIQQKYVRKKIFVRRARQAALRAKVSLYARDIPVAATGRVTGGRPGKGVARVGRKAFPGAFVNLVKGREHVLRRRTDQRYPIDVETYPLSRVGPKKLERAAAYRMREDFLKALRREFAWRYAKYRV